MSPGPHLSGSDRVRGGSDSRIGQRQARLIVGVDNQRTLSHASVMFDDLIPKGGNAFDTVWIYGDGLQERMLGRWPFDS